MSTVPSGHLNVPDGQEILNRVFIGGLARETSELELENFFSSFGEVVDVRIVCDRKTGLNKGYGFVTFSSTESRDELLKKGTIDYIGRKLRLRKAVKKEASGQFFTSDGTVTTQGVVANQLVLVPVVEPSVYSNPMSLRTGAWQVAIEDKQGGKQETMTTVQSETPLQMAPPGTVTLMNQWKESLPILIHIPAPYYQVQPAQNSFYIQPAQPAQYLYFY